MVNGPMGGFMGTPPAPAQPPQVNFTTTAESRGGFSNFLKSIPATTSMTPIPPMGSSPMPPMGGNPMANIDIFNQPSGMMGMNQPQMQQPQYGGGGFGGGFGGGMYGGGFNQQQPQQQQSYNPYAQPSRMSNFQQLK